VGVLVEMSSLLFRLTFQCWICYMSTKQRRLHKYCIDLHCMVWSWSNIVMVEMLILNTKTWEEEGGFPFMFDGVHLFSRTCLSFYLFLRQVVAWTYLYLIVFSCLVGLPLSYNWKSRIKNYLVRQHVCKDVVPNWTIVCYLLKIIWKAFDKKI